MSKTPDEMADEYLSKHFDDEQTAVSVMIFAPIYREVFLDGYKAGFEIGCMKGSMAMQSTLDDDYHLTPIIDHEKLAKVMTKKETE